MGRTDTREAMHGAILVDSGGTIVHQWAMAEESSPDSEDKNGTFVRS